MQASFVEIEDDVPSNNHRLSRAGRRTWYRQNRRWRVAFVRPPRPRVVVVLFALSFKEYCSKSRGSFDPVFRLRLSNGLPLHVAWFIGAAALQRLYVVDDEPATSSRCFAG
jgi:hypothetical protein